ncbi:MAG: hypothetical protein ABR889_05935 [Acidobacteriaceae bacterium]|jgi:hypothetical protein
MMKHGDMGVSRPAETRSFGARDWIIVFLLVMASIQCIRGCYCVNSSSLDWRTYAHGTAKLPYQGRVGMIGVLRWAEGSPLMIRGAAKLDRMDVGRYPEPMTVEKFTSLLAAILSMLLMLAFMIRFSLRHGYRPWWLPSVLMLAISFITLSVRCESMEWTPYDVPQALLFGVAVLCALDRQWYFVLPLFMVDVPWRETSIFLIAVCVPLFYTSEAVAWRQSRVRTIQTALLAIGMGTYWALVRHAIQVRYAHNGNDAYIHYSNNIHALMLPHHWPQMLGAGGYFLVFILLERSLASPRQRLILYSFLVCLPVILLYGVWVELRIWVEWTLPWSAIAASELQSYLRAGPETPKGYVLS